MTRLTCSERDKTFALSHHYSPLPSNTPSKAVVSTIIPFAHLVIKKSAPYQQPPHPASHHSPPKQPHHRCANNHTPGIRRRALQLAVKLHQLLEFAFRQVHGVLAQFALWGQVHALGEAPGREGFDHWWHFAAGAGGRGRSVEGGCSVQFESLMW